MNNKKFKGVITALVSPINNDGSIKKEVLRNYIDWQLSKDIDGFYVCGATGEGHAMSEKSRCDMTEIAVEQTNGRKAVIVHVGAHSVDSALKLAKHAEKAGADAISSLPPTAYSSYSEKEIFQYYQELAESTKLPLLVYATNLFQSSDITTFIEKLLRIPNIIGLKFTRKNYYEMRNIIELNNRDINVINGPDETLICGLTMGADGGIGATYNIMPEKYKELYNKFQSGDFNGAREVQFDINRIISIVIKHDLIPAIKCILETKGFDVGFAERPGKRFTDYEKSALIKELNQLGFYNN